MKTRPNNFKAGTYKRQHSGREYEYLSFMPSPVNHPYQWAAPEIHLLLEEASRFVGALDAYSTLIPDVDFFIQMHVRNEAVTSSRIEGTQTGMDEAVLPEEEIAPERKNDWSEVQNYIEAMNTSIKRLTELPISMRLVL